MFTCNPVYPKRTVNAMLTLICMTALWLFSEAIVADLPLAHAEEQKGTIHRVKETLSDNSILLESGETVRLASILIPKKQTSAQNIQLEEKTATEFLEELLTGKQIETKTSSTTHDRRNRIVAHMYLENGKWVQGALVTAGLAMVYPLVSNENHIKQLLALEKTAQQEKTGIWNHPQHYIVAHDEAMQYRDLFRIVEGIVQNVTEVRGNHYINFGEDWKTDFTAFISRSYGKRFKHTHLDALKGKRVQVRGIIYSYNGPTLDLTNPEQIEVIE